MPGSRLILVAVALGIALLLLYESFRVAGTQNSVANTTTVSALIHTAPPGVSASCTRTNSALTVSCEGRGDSNTTGWYLTVTGYGGAPLYLSKNVSSVSFSNEVFDLSQYNNSVLQVKVRVYQGEGDGYAGGVYCIAAADWLNGNLTPSACYLHAAS